MEGTISIGLREENDLPERQTRSKKKLYGKRNYDEVFLLLEANPFRVKNR